MVGQGISVVVPTRDRLPALEHTLGRLARQRGVDHEVVVVDNGSSDGTVAKVRSMAADYPVPLRVVEEARTGVSAARNRGMREAAHPVALHLNDDTAPEADDLLAGHLSQVAPGRAVMGHIRYREDQLRDPFMRFLGDHAQFTFEDMDPGPVRRPGRVYTAHLSLHRDDFDRAGGFDERLEFGFEDAEFAHRLLASGCEVHYRDDLVAVHDHPMGMRDWARRAERMGAAGHRVNTLTDAGLAQVPAGAYWRALTAGARFVETVPLPYGRLPAPARRAAYAVLNQGAYARGYRRARRAG